MGRGWKPGILKSGETCTWCMAPASFAIEATVPNSSWASDRCAACDGHAMHLRGVLAGEVPGPVVLRREGDTLILRELVPDSEWCALRAAEGIRRLVVEFMLATGNPRRTTATIEVSRKFGRDFPKPEPGQHRWILAAMFTVANPAASRFFLDGENLVSIEGPGCFHCEQVWSPEVHARDCVGYPKR